MISAYVPFPTPEVSAVIPVYKNADTVQELHYRLKQVLQTYQITYEIIFVEDACPDGSLERLIELTNWDPRVAVLALTQNTGQHRAVLAGLAHAQGQQIVVLDADLQDSPEAIPELLAKLGEGFTAVFAGKHGQYEPSLRLLTARIFKRLLHHLCGIPPDAGMFFVINHQMMTQLLSFYAPDPYIVAMIGCTRLPITSVPVIRVHRRSGRSAYNAWKRIRIGCSAIIWTLIWRGWPRTRKASQPKAIVPVKAYFGARFSSAQMEQRV